jgi:hypothetical protein
MSQNAQSYIYKRNKTIDGVKIIPEETIWLYWVNRRQEPDPARSVKQGFLEPGALWKGFLRSNSVHEAAELKEEERIQQD